MPAQPTQSAHRHNALGLTASIGRHQRNLLTLVSAKLVDQVIGLSLPPVQRKPERAYGKTYYVKRWSEFLFMGFPWAFLGLCHT